MVPVIFPRQPIELIFLASRVGIFQGFFLLVRVTFLTPHYLTRKLFLTKLMTFLIDRMMRIIFWSSIKHLSFRSVFPVFKNLLVFFEQSAVLDNVTSRSGNWFTPHVNWLILNIPPPHPAHTHTQLAVLDSGLSPNQFSRTEKTVSLFHRIIHLLERKIWYTKLFFVLETKFPKGKYQLLFYDRNWMVRRKGWWLRSSLWTCQWRAPASGPAAVPPPSTSSPPSSSPLHRELSPSW